MDANKKDTGSKQGNQSGKDNMQSDAASTRNASGAGKQGGTHEQHVEAGRQSHKNSGSQDASEAGNIGSGGGASGNRQSDSGTDTSSKQSASRSSGSDSDSAAGSRSGTQGGTREQHVEAGRQSHKKTK